MGFYCFISFGWFGIEEINLAFAGKLSYSSIGQVLNTLITLPNHEKKFSTFICYSH